MKRREDELFRGWSAPRASSELKTRILGAAKKSARFAKPRGITDVLWESRSVRWAASAAAVILLVVNVVFIAPSSPSPVRRSGPVERSLLEEFSTMDPVVADRISRSTAHRRRQPVKRDDILRLLWSDGEAEGGVTYEGREST